MKLIRSKWFFACLLAGAVVGAQVACSDDDNHNATTTLPPYEAGVQPTDAGGEGGIPGAGADIHIAGLSAPVHVVYDEYGFLHISAKTDEDAFAALGYFHAANRFFFMDFLRNAIRGTLGKMISAPGIVDRDVTSRTFFATRSGDPLPEALVAQFDDAGKASVDAYSKGVNAWLADMRAGKNGATLTSEYNQAASRDIRDWEPADTTAVALYSLNDLSNNADYEVTLGRVAQAAQAVAGAKPALAKTLQDLYLDMRPSFDAYTIPAAQQSALYRGKEKIKAHPEAAKALAMANERLQMLPGSHGPKQTGDFGSNNWVIAGTRAMGGRPLLANDPHLQLTNPSIWFPVEIDGKTGGTGTYHAAGGSFPGIPTIQTGHNENIAWGVTTSYWDLSDVYLETLTSATSVKFNGGSTPITFKNVDFIDQGKTVTKTLAWVPQHGPIVSIDTNAGTAVTIRWRGHDGGTDLAAFLGMGRAANLADAKAALANVTTANQNFVVATKDNQIGFYPYAKVPIRTWASHNPGVDSPFFPLPGDGTREWGDPVAVADIPQIENPPAGFIATANADLTGAFQAGDPFTPALGNKPVQAASRSEGTRLQRIIEVLKASGNTNTVETMRLLQSDTKSLIAQIVVPRLVAAAADTAAGGFDKTETKTAAVIAALTAYQTTATYTCPVGLDGLDPFGAPKTADAKIASESIGCAAFHTALYALIEAAFGDDFGDTSIAAAQLGTASGNPNNVIPVLLRALRNDAQQPGELFWIDSRVTDHTTTRSEILQRALTQAGAALGGALGNTADDWRWGRMHGVILKSPLSSPTLQIFDSSTFATPGGLYTVDVANPASVNLADNSAANRVRFLASNGPSIRTLIEVQTDRPHLKIELPGGSDLHRDGKFYNNMVPNWVSSTPVDFAFGAGAVQNPALDLQVNP